MFERVVKAAGKVGYFAKKHKSEIMLIAGLVGNTAGIVLVGRASAKLPDKLEDATAVIRDIHYDKDNDITGEYTDEQYRKDLARAYFSKAGQIIKLYALPTALIGLSDALIVGGHVTLRRENLALTGAYVALNESFKKYRERVEADRGEDKDKEYMHGTDKKDIPDGDEKSEKKKGSISVYTRVFDQSNPNWNRDPELNIRFLTRVQRDLNDRLLARGYLFLNEAYEAVGLKPTQIGQIVGWVDHGWKDTYIDFFQYDTESPEMRDYLAGLTDYLILDFDSNRSICPVFYVPEGWESKQDILADTIEHSLIEE